MLVEDPDALVDQGPGRAVVGHGGGAEQDPIRHQRQDRRGALVAGGGAVACVDPVERGGEQEEPLALGLRIGALGSGERVHEREESAPRSSAERASRIRPRPSNSESSQASPSSRRPTSGQPPHRLAAVAARNTAGGVRCEESSTTGVISRLACQGRPRPRARRAVSSSESAFERSGTESRSDRGIRHDRRGDLGLELERGDGDREEQRELCQRHQTGWFGWE